MKRRILFGLIAIMTGFGLTAQHTFSIVAVDPVTGEVGSAGASCLDVTNRGMSADIISQLLKFCLKNIKNLISQLFPNKCSINCQAHYNPANQLIAKQRLNSGYSPGDIIEWLITHDVDGFPAYRQYGIAVLSDKGAVANAYSGDSISGYYNHIIGEDYAIQGNTLMDQSILDSMEYYFLNTKGDLACKLMAALQGANKTGADSRCTKNGTSSLLAFIKIAQPSDKFGEPSLRINVETSFNDGIEPIEVVQLKFDVLHSCNND